MNLTLDRQTNGLTCTLGELSINGEFICYTLEDIVREDDRPVSEWKVPHETAIPTGEYELRLAWSNRFQHFMPKLMDVPGFEGILIHSGNVSADTSGCILVGMDIGPEQESILRSRVAYDGLMAQLNPAFQSGEAITVEVK